MESWCDAAAFAKASYAQKPPLASDLALAGSLSAMVAEGWRFRQCSESTNGQFEKTREDERRREFEPGPIAH